MLKQVKIYGLSLAVILSLNMSCTAVQNSNKTQRGAGIGVAAGALVGGLIGGNIGGALIGAAIGGAAGAVIGNQMDKQADKIEEAVPGAEVKRVGEGIQIIFDDKSGVNFAFDSSDLTAEAKKNLDAVAEIFIEFPDTELMIEGHTDSVGDENYNMKLSQRRANSVVAYLKSKGVAGNRFKVEAFGETRPRFENDTKENQAKNRRVEIGVAANEQMIEDAKAQTE
ncbi:OmpA family protein [Lutimonas zeaxanthinifaciens]|uniref:OmpA family protein n=1 Tax=Lutimonas zeaxanthinifaciens TaxID=3060215 RepID=UPI00265CF03F|nr:OmpA family protein [Lutimonas sp. YSD2104]WKK64568.1 OmpA family protein [Lutimonas sp. YSD2104]